MSIKLRKISKHKPCHQCGADLKGKYGAEIGLIITITLCANCADLHKAQIFNLPDELEYLPKALTFAPLALERGTK